MVQMLSYYTSQPRVALPIPLWPPDAELFPLAFLPPIAPQHRHREIRNSLDKYWHRGHPQSAFFRWFLLVSQIVHGRPVDSWLLQSICSRQHAPHYHRIRRLAVDSFHNQVLLIRQFVAPSASSIVFFYLSHHLDRELYARLIPLHECTEHELSGFE
ncbi:unnamed protein product [Albugo candida]|uniref:Uncharacterized protein n=1 Tax=Albugo candida TaxID=65357 RepID=A0A024G9L8_9STRA|nr:unnamed protein product [Albugo candida]|eukprot:CCI43576.1 unnamed protein product [Albugo candida]